MVWESLAEFRGTSKRAIGHFASARTSVPASLIPNPLYASTSNDLVSLFPFEMIQWYWFQTYECIIKRII